VDVAERVRLITDARRHHPLVDASARSSARRRAARLGRRAGVQASPVDIGDCGRVLALAYPDRIAQARGRGRFRLRSGAGAWMAESDPLAGEAFVVVAQLDAEQRDSRIRLAAALDGADLEAAAGASIISATTVAWDDQSDDLRAIVTRSLDGLILGSTERKAPPGPATTAALVDHVGATRLAALPWTGAARALQQRVMFLRRTFGDDWPDLSDPALLATIDDWLTPLLAGAVDRAGIERLDLAQALRNLLAYPQRAALDTLAPRTVAVTPRRKLTVDYRHDQPTVAARIQDLFGTNSHPTIAGGRVPLVVHLLSPAGRPVQVTADLPGFWAGSYAAVRKEMAGRYPKHPWPADPGKSASAG
jgi:ATP-dependent helicase HrpB